MLGGLRAQRSQWEKLAAADPLWAILTGPGRKNGAWTDREFFATGEQEIAAVLARAATLGVPSAYATALDFGCGVGRLTQALAARFDRVTGVDIAPSMIGRAREYNRHPGRCDYLVNEGAALPAFPDSSCDLVCSLITLQHVPPRQIRAYVREFVRVLRPGGLLVFQLPDSYRYWKAALTHTMYRWMTRRVFRVPSVMEMHGIHRHKVEALLAECGARVLAVDEDGLAGECWLAYRYYVTR